MPRSRGKSACAFGRVRAVIPGSSRRRGSSAAITRTWTRRRRGARRSLPSCSSDPTTGPGQSGPRRSSPKIPEILELHHVAGEDCFSRRCRRARRRGARPTAARSAEPDRHRSPRRGTTIVLAGRQGDRSSSDRRGRNRRTKRRPVLDVEMAGVSPQKAKLVGGLRGGLCPLGVDVPRDPLRRRDDPAVSHGGDAPPGGRVTALLWLRLQAAARARTGGTGATAAVIGGLMLLGGNGLVTRAGAARPVGARGAHRRVGAALDGAPRRHPQADAAASPRRRRARHRPRGASRPRRAGDLAGNGRVDLLGRRRAPARGPVLTAGSLLPARRGCRKSVLTVTAMEMIGGGSLLWVVGLGGGRRLAAGPRGRLDALAPVARVPDRLRIAHRALRVRVPLHATTPARVSTYAYVNPVVAVLLDGPSPARP